MSTDWSETDIAAFVDGELEGADARRVAAIIESDPAARALADRLADTDALLRAAFDAPMREPVPPALAAVVREAPRVTVAEPKGRPRPVWFPAAMAAGIALAIGFGAGGVLVGPDAPPVGGPGVGPAPAALRTVLEETPSGVVRSGVRPIASFEVADGICREFERLADGGVAVAAGIACRDAADAWSIVVVAATGADEASPGEGFTPAAGVAGDTLSATLDALGAGSVLSPEAEAARIAAGWR